MTTAALPGPIRRFALADLMFPRGIEGLTRRLLYLLFAFPLLAFLVVAIPLGVPTFLSFVLLGGLGAPAWLVLAIVAGALLLGCVWFATSFIAGVTWVLQARNGPDHGQPE